MYVRVLLLNNHGSISDSSGIFNSTFCNAQAGSTVHTASRSLIAVIAFLWIKFPEPEIYVALITSM
jgi:hypothetical protein